MAPSSPLPLAARAVGDFAMPRQHREVIRRVNGPRVCMLKELSSLFRSCRAAGCAAAIPCVDAEGIDRCPQRRWLVQCLWTGGWVGRWPFGLDVGRRCSRDGARFSSHSFAHACTLPMGRPMGVSHVEQHVAFVDVDANRRVGQHRSTQAHNGVHLEAVRRVMQGAGTSGARGRATLPQQHTGDSTIPVRFLRSTSAGGACMAIARAREVVRLGRTCVRLEADKRKLKDVSRRFRRGVVRWGEQHPCAAP